MTRKIAAVFCAALLGACASPPIKVGPRPDIAGIEQQNITTIKEVTAFSKSNIRAGTHVKKVREKAAQGATSLQTAKKYLEELLAENPE